MWVAWIFLLAASQTYAQKVDVHFFENRIRPILVDHCHSCHSSTAEKVKGGLWLNSREALLQGGETGAAIVPGKPDESLLIKAVRYEDAHLQMPPKNKRLSTRQIQDLALWIQGGAPWPEPDRTPSSSRVAPTSTESTNLHWAFQPVRRAPPPRVASAAWNENPIDAFIAARLEQAGLKTGSPASRRELIRRATFDLIGLPPTPEEIDAFESDPTPEAFARVVDRLLSRAEYGERWGRHWLDVVRFAQSNGYERDGEKVLAWRYRDYVVQAFNQDKPYDRFVMEQLAGDELVDATAESVVATGFQRLGVWDDEPDDRRLAEFDELDDILSTTGAAFMGLTLGCARCHDHKFDPISITDYYQLLSFFRPIKPHENAKFSLDSASYLPLSAPSQVSAWSRQRGAQVMDVERVLGRLSETNTRPALEARLKQLKESQPPGEWALGIRERDGAIPPTHVLVRGNPATPGKEVQPRFPSILGGGAPELKDLDRNPDVRSSGRRSALARWLVRPEHPLTARVMVNRIWHHHFGRGLVKTTTDFGKAGVPPTHPELLDWLAADFVSSGWSIKHMHRRIMLSRTYQLSSRIQDEQAQAANPGNELLWRQNLRRLEAEAVRDSMLHVTGNLNPKRGGRGFFPRLAGEVLAGASRPGLDWDLSPQEDLMRRSVYAYVRRTMAVPLLEGFDYSNTTSPLGERPLTTVAPQALMLLNDPWVGQLASSWSERLGTPSTLSEQENWIGKAYRQAFGRAPTSAEIQTGIDFIKRQSALARSTLTRKIFRTDVPEALSTSYMDQLKPEHFVVGPSSGWKYYRGFWAGAYEGIRAMERYRGPFTLAETATFAEGKLQATLQLDPSSEYVSVLFQARAQGDESRGYEIVFHPKLQTLSFWRQDTLRTKLLETECRLPASVPMELTVRREGNVFRLNLESGGVPLLKPVEYRDEKPWMEPGFTGIRVWGAPVAVDHWSVTRPGEPREEPSAGSGPDPDVRARQLFCLMLLNLNEFVYVD